MCATRWNADSEGAAAIYLAFDANLAAMFFDLDSDLTSSLYLVGTALFFIITLPLFAVLAAVP